METTTHKRNAETSEQEVAAFIADKPSRYFAYHAAKPSGFDPIRRLHHGDKIATWTGDELGSVIEANAPFRSNMDDIRQNFRTKGINGITYSGTAYLSAGDYVRMTAVKS